MSKSELFGRNRPPSKVITNPMSQEPVSPKTRVLLAAAGVGEILIFNQYLLGAGLIALGILMNKKHKVSSDVSIFNKEVRQRRKEINSLNKLYRGEVKNNV